MNKIRWAVLRTMLFIIIGLFNTALIKPEDVGSWKNYLGYLFLFIALVDSIILIKKFLQKTNEVKQ